MNAFLIDNEIVYTYENLLNDINKAAFYYPSYRTTVLYDYFVNFIVALLVDKPLVLIDSEINETEMDLINSEFINVSSPIVLIKLSSVDEVLKKIVESTSEINIFTSGTTGQPKKVIHSVRTLTRSIRIYDNNSPQIWGFAYNPTHMAGLQVFFQALMNKCILVNIFNKSRNEIFRTIEKFEISHLSATPTFYRLLLPVENSYNSVLRVTFGGERSDKKLHEAILKIFPNAKINNIYASTEAGSLFSAKGEYFQIPEEIYSKIKIIDNELLIHRSLLGESDSFTFSGEYYNSGDLIEWVDEMNGLFRFTSRKNEMVNVGGYKVNPSEVERFILEIQGVNEVVVFGKPNSVLGNILCAEVKLDDNCELSELFIRNKLFEKLQDFKIPRRIKFVDSFSITRTGKIKRV